MLFLCSPKGFAVTSSDRLRGSRRGRGVVIHGHSNIRTFENIRDTRLLTVDWVSGVVKGEFLCCALGVWKVLELSSKGLYNGTPDQSAPFVLSCVFLFFLLAGAHSSILGSFQVEVR